MFQYIGILLLLTFPRLVFAQKFLAPDFKFKLSDVGPNTLGEFISEVYHTAIPLAGTIAVVLMLWGGLKWISAGGNPSQVEAAKETIYSALLGLLLAIGSYALLYTVNPDLINLKPLNISNVNEIKSTPLTIESQIKAADAESDAGSGPVGPDGKPVPAAARGTPFTGPVDPNCVILANNPNIKFLQDNDRTQIGTGVIVGRANEQNNNVSRTIRVSPDLCASLNAAVAAGYKPVVRSVVGGHRLGNGTGGISPHLDADGNGRGMDINNDEALVKFYYDNRERLGITQIVTHTFPQYNFNSNAGDHTDHTHITYRHLP